MTSPFTVTVPATTANLGPGFDCLGVALSLHNRFHFAVDDSADDGSMTIAVRGAEADRVATDDRNLVAQVFSKLFAHLDRTPPPVRLDIDLAVPLARGLGSSATAIVGGLLGANQLAGEPLTTTELMQMAIALESHPDNVVPALLGGCQLAVCELDSAANPTPTTPWQICPIPWHPQLVPIVAIPDFELSTAAARKVLPDRYDRADAIFNAAHLALLLQGLSSGDGDRLRVGMRDRVHQPYRQTLIPGYNRVRDAALNAGAHGLAISGAGPTLLALATPERTDAVVTALTEAWQAAGTPAIVRSLALDLDGATVSFQDTSP